MARQSDIPFERDQSTRFLPWIVAVMVFLAALAMASAIAVGDAIESWDSKLTGRMTIQIPADDPEIADRKAADIVRQLDTLSGVAEATVITPQKVRDLLEPWLGATARDGAFDELPVPRLIDIELAGKPRLDKDRLRRVITDIAPKAIVDDHRVWLDALIDLARLVELIAFLVLILIAVSAIAAVVFATRSGLAVHASIIELLHLMGAHDRFIARQFEAHAMWLGIRGGLIGSIAATTVIAAISWVARDIDATFLPTLRPTVAHAAMLAAVPVAAIVIAMMTARLTVMRALARLP